MLILLHSSKTMQPATAQTSEQLSAPQLLAQAKQLQAQLQKLSPTKLAELMKISHPMAEATHTLIEKWHTNATNQSAAIDCFLGDIYSGLQAQTLSPEDRKYAQEHLRILSGLYGILRPLDAVTPYRLEMGYRLTGKGYKNLYEFWGESIASTIAQNTDICNLSALEYTRTVLPFIDAKRVVSPVFLTKNNSTGQPTFVTVHTKIARGAFAHWLITQKINSFSRLGEFSELGYKYNEPLSEQEGEPVFVCKNFKGTGLSVRLLRR